MRMLPCHGAPLSVCNARPLSGIEPCPNSPCLAITCDPHLHAEADRTLLRLALVNLVHNAIQHSPPGTCIELSAAWRDGELEISVRDNGPGIPAELHGKIFERFYRIDKARSRAEGGVGLGLAIAKQAAERNGGRIEVESATGRGSDFRIVFA